MKIDIPFDEMIKKIEARKGVIVNISKRLHQFDKKNHYWSYRLKLAEEDYMFETSMVQSWIGYRFRPKKIL